MLFEKKYDFVNVSNLPGCYGCSDRTVVIIAHYYICIIIIIRNIIERRLVVLLFVFVTIMMTMYLSTIYVRMKKEGINSSP